MRVLLDECLPKRLTQELPGHEARTVQQMGWSGKTNGELLVLIRGQFDVFITVDKNIMFQQHSELFPFALIVLRAKTNKIEDIRPLIPEILSALNTLGRGEVLRIGTGS